MGRPRIYPSEARREKIIERSAANYLKWRTILHAMKDFPCMDCGNRFHPCQMQFDHRPGTVKKFNLGEPNHSLSSMLEEREKCDLVCANCHALRTWVTRKIK